MDDKTADLRDLFVETTGEEGVTERQTAARGSLSAADGDAAAERLRELVADEHQWRTVDSLEVVDPSLEDVFIDLTGRELRDRTTNLSS